MRSLRNLLNQNRASIEPYGTPEMFFLKSIVEVTYLTILFLVLGRYDERQGRLTFVSRIKFMTSICSSTSIEKECVTDFSGYMMIARNVAYFTTISAISLAERLLNLVEAFILD